MFRTVKRITDLPAHTMKYSSSELAVPYVCGPDKKTSKSHLSENKYLLYNEHVKKQLYLIYLLICSSFV